MAFDPFSDAPFGALDDEAPALLFGVAALAANPDLRATFLVEFRANRLTAAYLSTDEATFSDAPFGAELDEDGGTSAIDADYLFSDRPWIGSPVDSAKPNTAAECRLMSAGRVSRTLPLYPEDARRAQIQSGDIEVANADGALDELFLSRSIAGRLIKTMMGPASGDYGQFETVLETFGEGVEGSGGVLRLKLQTTSFLVNSVVQPSRYRGTGLLEGDSELAGRPRPLLLGEAFNLSPVLINRDEWVYQISDGPIYAVDAVRERGLELTDSGADVATLAELRSLAVAGGEFATSLQSGMVKCGFGGSGPTGPVTVDARGDVASGVYTDRIGEILLRLVERRAQVPASLIDRASFSVLPDYPIGYYLDGSTDPTIEDVLDELLRSIGGWHGTRRKRRLRVGLIEPPDKRTARLTIDDGDILSITSETPQRPARYRQAALYLLNWTPMAENDISAVVDADLRSRLLAIGETVKSSASAVRLRDASAEDGGTITTFCRDAADAQAICAGVLDMFGETRRAFRVTLNRRGYAVDVGDVVSLVSDRYGLTDGRNMLIVSCDDDGANGVVQILAWG